MILSLFSKTPLREKVGETGFQNTQGITGVFLKISSFQSWKHFERREGRVVSVTVVVEAGGL